MSLAIDIKVRFPFISVFFLCDHNRGISATNFEISERLRFLLVKLSILNETLLLSI